jgi:hypothetical protein
VITARATSYEALNIQLLDAKENNTNLARIIANLTAEYDLLLTEKEYYKDNYEHILEDYIELLASYPIPYCSSLSNCDNFNDYWEIDTDDTITVSQNKINWNNME